MKIKLSLWTAAVLFLFSIPSYAIEGLTLSIQSSNVVLTWPSVDGETYIVQHRASLDTDDTWQTLTNFFPATAGTNFTSFVDSNAVCIPVGGGSSGGGVSEGPPIPENNSFAQTSQETSYPPLPPLPWDTNSYNSVRSSDFTANSLSSEEEETGTGVCAGFYRVVRNGSHIVGLTNGTILSGGHTFQVEVGNDDGELQFVNVMDNGESFEGASEIYLPFPGILSFELNTTRMTNGPHVLQVEAYWITSDSQPASASPMLSLRSESVTITVSNEVSFPYWEPQYIDEYDWALIQAQSAHPVADWQIDIYDNSANYLGSFMSGTTNGTIAALWNLHDYNGVRRTNDSFQFVVSTAWSGSGVGSGGTAAALSPPAYKGHDNWPAYGNWVVANQLGFSGQSTINLMVDTVIEAAEAHYYDVLPTPVAGEAFRLHTSSGSPSNDWATLKSALTNFDSRNFYYFGHGSPSAIGGYTNSAAALSAGYSDNGLGLNSGEIRLALNNFNFGHFQSTNQHHYRFVFIDGCESATAGLPGAFEIGNTRAPDLTYYPPGGARPSAFLGYTAKPIIATAGSLFTDHVNYVGYFFEEWGLNGKKLQDAVKDAKNNHLGQTSLFNLSILTIKGYKDLLFDEGNFQ